ncbi:Serine/threonine protein kinase [Sanguibacter gelidistatuariae]|uniref:non-specific serine/threonine protein kinase n=1 Tax=Sanguibacter gelidistatuariae TaxID=1814289 RepID=A0A1G6WY26_9MICO|nr:serine/threonine-protein kinase [Sanguibacter gelidistatuariae]SDD70812.1 Serine/threonine protein kinase [Sanguibacter gelidistatuariae]
MSSRRPPSQPPEINGYSYLRLIGSGGFADVFLYQEFRPRRQVAIKVLLPQWSEGASREAFAAEADLMATVSSHPSIVTIFDSDVTKDGRLFLTMEYCSRPNLSTRYKTERLGIAETLRIGIQIAGAVETAHRSGIVHRDIKPANILVTDYGHPALTDFGISATIEQSEAGADGMSVPWSPPENLTAAPRSGVTSDVWSLAATMYTLLSGRSPFEVPGGVNSQRALIERITGAPLPPLERGDVPASFERVLEAAMAKEPDQRYPSMLDLGRALQQVQMGLNLAVTPIDIINDSQAAFEISAADGHETGGGEGDDEVDGGTRIRIASDRFHPGYGVAHAAAPRREPPVATVLVDSVSGIGSDSTSTSYGSIHGVPYVPQRPAVAPPAPALTDAAPDLRRATRPAAASGATSWVRRRPLAVVVALALALGVTGGVIIYDRLVAVTMELSASRVPQPVDLAATPTADGSAATFSWVNPDPRDGDFYAYRAGDGSFRKTALLNVSVNTFNVKDPCVEVVVVRDGRISTEPARACLG